MGRTHPRSSNGIAALKFRSGGRPTGPALLLMTLAAAAAWAPAALLPAAHAAPLPVVVDGIYDEWAGVVPAHSDPQGDGGASGVDFADLWIADDPRFLFLRFETGAEISLDENNNLVLYLDTDANAGTGRVVGGIGAELEWHLGTRGGTFYRGGQSWPVEQADLGFVSMPTVTATAFEAALDRDRSPNGSDPLFFGGQLRILLRDEAGGGDWLPNSGQTVSYTMDAGPPPARAAIPFARERAEDLRVTTINTLNDGPWQAGKGPRFGRLLAAVDPSILNFQEIYNHTPAQTAAFVEGWLPSGPGETWYSAGNQDCKTVSRYPLGGTWNLDGNLAVLIDTTPVLGTQLLIVNVHLPCCTDDAGRQQEVDRILSFLRDAKSPGGAISLPADTPYMILGDMNFVGLAQQLRSLAEGDVVNEQTYGADFPPDWDGSDLTDLVPRQTELGMAYTWRSDTSTFWPGQLDHMIYTDAVLELGNHYLVYTPEMSADSLAAHGLLGSDSQASDHLLVCTDFRPPVPVSADSTEQAGAGWLRIGPNPTRREVTITLECPAPSQVWIDVFDLQGRWVARPFGVAGRAVPAGRTDHAWRPDAAASGRLPGGVYFLRAHAVAGADETRAVVRWVFTP